MEDFATLVEFQLTFIPVYVLLFINIVATAVRVSDYPFDKVGENILAAQFWVSIFQAAGWLCLIVYWVSQPKERSVSRADRFIVYSRLKCTFWILYIRFIHVLLFICIVGPQYHRDSTYLLYSLLVFIIGEVISIFKDCVCFYFAEIITCLGKSFETEENLVKLNMFRFANGFKAVWLIMFMIVHYVMEDRPVASDYPFLLSCIGLLLCLVFF
jgi:hypothetical protein